MSSCGALLLFLALLGLPETSHFNREKCVNPSFLACYFLNKAQMCIAPVYSELIRHEIEIPQNAICWRWSCHLSLFFVNAFICTGCMSSPRRPLWGCHLPPLVLNWLVSSLLSGCLSLTRPNKIYILTAPHTPVAKDGTGSAAALRPICPVCTAICIRFYPLVIFQYQLLWLWLLSDYFYLIVEPFSAISSTL